MQRMSLRGMNGGIGVPPVYWGWPARCRSHQQSPKQRNCFAPLAMTVPCEWTCLEHSLLDLIRQKPYPVKNCSEDIVVGIEEVLLGLADRVLDFDEASLTQLQEKYLKKVSEFSPSRDWEKAIVVYFLINSIRVKNKIFNEKVKASKTGAERPKRSKSLFKIVK
jgi:hypothetical protein